MYTNLFSTDSFKNQKNLHILTHWHNNIELIRILDGTLHCLIQGQEYTIVKDCICIINKNQPHKIYCDKKNKCNFQCLIIDPRLFTSDKDILSKYIEPVLTDEEFSHVISKKNTFSKEIINLMEAIGELEKQRFDAYELSVIAFLHMIFQKLYALHKTIANKETSNGNINVLPYRKMADFIYKNYTHKLLLADIANAGNISRSKCCVLFKKFAHHSPIEFLNLYRLEISTEMLENTNDSITSIALSSGFGQSSYYNRLFLREYGITPREYRKTYCTFINSAHKNCT